MMRGDTTGYPNAGGTAGLSVFDFPVPERAEEFFLGLFCLIGKFAMSGARIAIGNSWRAAVLSQPFFITGNSKFSNIFDSGFRA